MVKTVLVIFSLLLLKSEGFRFSVRKKREMAKKKLATIAEKKRRSTRKKSVLSDILDEDDEYGGDEPSQSDRERERYEAAQIRALERSERGKLYRIVLDEFGGIKPSESLKEEYRAIPNTYKRKDGFPGDEVASYLSTQYQEFGIDSENDLIQYFAAA